MAVAKKAGKVIIFDYDGTIVDSGDLVYKSFNEIAKKYGIKPIKTISKFSELYNKNIYDSIVDLGVSRKELPALINDWRRPFLDPNADVKLFPGMREVLNEISKKYIIFVVTSNSTEAIELSIKRFNLNKISKVLGAEVSTSKVEKIKMIREEYPNSDIYYIGDTKGDVIEAKKIGVKIIAVAWGVHSRTQIERARPDYIIDKPEELLRILN